MFKVEPYGRNTLLIKFKDPNSVKYVFQHILNVFAYERPTTIYISPIYDINATYHTIKHMYSIQTVEDNTCIFTVFWNSYYRQKIIEVYQDLITDKDYFSDYEVVNEYVFKLKYLQYKHLRDLPLSQQKYLLMKNLKGIIQKLHDISSNSYEFYKPLTKEDIKLRCYLLLSQQFNIDPQGIVETKLDEIVSFIYETQSFSLNVGQLEYLILYKNKLEFDLTNVNYYTDHNNTLIYPLLSHFYITLSEQLWVISKVLDTKYDSLLNYASNLIRNVDKHMLKILLALYSTEIDDSLRRKLLQSYGVIKI